MVGRRDEHDIAKELPWNGNRQDLPDGRTRIQLRSDFDPRDYREDFPIERHRIIDRATGQPVLDLWHLDCTADHKWQDGLLHLSIEPTKLTLRIDLSQARYRSGDGPWRPISELQAEVEQAVGTGYGVKAAWLTESPMRDEAMRRAMLKERRDAVVGMVMVPVLLSRLSRRSSTAMRRARRCLGGNLQR